MTALRKIRRQMLHQSEWGVYCNLICINWQRLVYPGSNQSSWLWQPNVLWPTCTRKSSGWTVFKLFSLVVPSPHKSNIPKRSLCFLGPIMISIINILNTLSGPFFMGSQGGIFSVCLPSLIFSETDRSSSMSIFLKHYETYLPGLNCRKEAQLNLLSNEDFQWTFYVIHSLQLEMGTSQCPCMKNVNIWLCI